MPLLTANGTQLYYEMRGDGPPLLFIMGMTGDAGHFEKVAELLADELTVVTYDRRGNGRSPRPAGWETTSPEEQSADAAGLLEALGLAPAAVFGTSTGANIALCLVIGHPELVRGVILHDPAMFSLFDDPEAVQSAATAILESGLESGGPQVALERYWRFAVGDANWGQLDPSLRERMLASAETWLEVELGSFEGFLPDDETLAAIVPPVQLLVSEQTHPFLKQAADKLAARIGTHVRSTPGMHGAYHDRPHELAETVRPFLRQTSGIRL